MRGSTAPRAPPMAPRPTYTNDIGIVGISSTPIARTMSLAWSPPSNLDIHRIDARFEPPIYPHRIFRRHHDLHVEVETRGCPSAWPTLWHATRLAVYHVSYWGLSVVGGGLVLAGFALSILLLPLCGFGVVVFRVLLQTANDLSRADATLYNFIASANTKIQFPDGISTAAERTPLLPVYDTHHRSASSMVSPRFHVLSEHHVFSSRHVAVVLYFATVRVPLTCLGVLASHLLWICLLALVVDDPTVPFANDANDANDPWTYPRCFVGVLVAGAALHGLAHVAQVATRFVCCSDRL